MTTFTQLIESDKSIKDFIEDAVTSDIAIERPNQSPDKPYEDDEIMNKSHILGFLEEEKKLHYLRLEQQMLMMQDL